ncbi:Ankyrin repeat-containing protein [Vitis vinifera]|uniref:Ankyrin repeat-containing protein n=1 Tax=Vitis vinifera TaxID=29760 RepID=A0A438FX57_VITVI|nr:Ankyrin repeat-containing protein [Vitis vinifera]
MESIFWLRARTSPPPLHHTTSFAAKGDHLPSHKHDEWSRPLHFTSLPTHKHLMDQLGASNLSAEFQNLDMDSNSNQVVAQDPSPAQTPTRLQMEMAATLSSQAWMRTCTRRQQRGTLKLPSSSSLLQHPNLKGDIPLHLAAREGHFEVLKALLDAAKTLPTDIETGLEADKLMLRMTNKEKDTALHEAVRYGYRHQYSLVKLLIEKDPDYTYGANVSGGTPLYMAAERGFTRMVKMILEKVTKLALHQPTGASWVERPCMLLYSAMTKAILEWNPALTKEVDEKGWSPLHCAAERNCDATIVRQLLENSDKSVAYLGIRDGLVNEKDGQGNTPIHLLSSHQISDFRFLVDWNVDKKAYNSENLTAYDIISEGRGGHFQEKAMNAQALVKGTWALLTVEPFHHLSIVLQCSQEVDIIKQLMDEKESKEDKEKRIVALREQGQNHLIVSALITTVTFAAGFTLPGGYKDDNGKAILSKKAAFITFVVADTICNDPHPTM